MLRLESVEKNQIGVYAAALILGAGTGLLSPAIGMFVEHTISLMIAILLFSMFCQIPFLKLREALSNGRFMGALLLVNFVLTPVLVYILTLVFPQPAPVLLGVCLVLLTPCIDYVIVFTQLGRGDERLILASTPILFVVQIMMLPFYLWLFLGSEAAEMVKVGPFVEAFTFLIIVPLLLALTAQFWAKKSAKGSKSLELTAWLPVPFMALVLFVVIASQIGRVYEDIIVIIAVIPIYVLFHIMTPIVSRAISAFFRIGPKDGRALIFSAGTRNSLVVLPLALTLPEEMATTVAAVIVTQIVIELIAELVYIRIVPNLIYRDRK